MTHERHKEVMMGAANFDQPSVGNVSSSRDALSITNTGSGRVLVCRSNNEGAIDAASSARTAVKGTSNTGAGLLGHSRDNDGVVGTSSNGNGVHGQAGELLHAIFPPPPVPVRNGVHGESFHDAGDEVLDRNGVLGEHHGDGVGVCGSSARQVGVLGLCHSPEGTGLVAIAGDFHRDGKSFGVYAATEGHGEHDCAFTGVVNAGSKGLAGRFVGNVKVYGRLEKSGGGFRIDHPLDPAHKYLVHAFVESSEMKNLYDGVTYLDAHGGATIELPSWFDALNRDFRYQLTPIGSPAPGLHIASEIENGRFRISGGTAGQKVCWQVSGVRRDAWANANPLVSEEQKAADEQDLFLCPEAFGEPPEKSLGQAFEPALVRRIRRTRQP
jgi:hypothetical protein